MNSAALVVFVGGGDESLSLCPQACLNGDGIAGVFWWEGGGFVHRRGTEISFDFRAVEVPFILGLVSTETGKADAGAISLVVDGAGAADSAEEDGGSVSSSRRRFLVFVSETSGTDSFIRAVDGRGEPNVGDW
jgi:hypothetical protein